MKNTLSASAMAVFSAVVAAKAPRLLASKAVEAKSVRKTPRVVVGRIASLTQLVVSCVGFGIMPSASIADELASGALLRILPDYHDHKIPMLAVYGYQNTVPLKVRAFLGYMKANLHFPAGD